jgi:hypothetical protein
MVKDVPGKPHDMDPGTNMMLMAKIAKTLVREDPSLLRPKNKDKLLAEIEAIYRPDHCKWIDLRPAFRKMQRLAASVAP